MTEVKLSEMRPQDVLILLKIIAKSDKDWANKSIAYELNISQSEVSNSLKRSQYAGLIDASKKKVRVQALFDFLKEGIQYVYPAHPGPLVRGVPTAHSAPPLDKEIVSSEVYVWPSANGKSRGQAIAPLYPTVPEAVSSDEKLYEMLALVDAIRVGRAREKEIAKRTLKEYMLNA